MNLLVHKKVLELKKRKKSGFAFFVASCSKVPFAKSQDNPHKNVNFQVKSGTCSYTCTKQGLSGMLLYGTRGIFPLREIEFKTNTHYTIHPSAQHCGETLLPGG